MRPALTVVVLSWDMLDLTKRCLESLGADGDPRIEVVIVDNGSSDGSVDMARAFGRVIENPANRGFSAAMNQGLEAASGDVIVFANNDTVFPDGWVDRLLPHFADDEVGLVYPVVTRAGHRFTERREPGTEVIDVRPFAELLSAVVVAMHTSTARALGGWSTVYDTAGGEDFELLFTAWANSLQVRVDERILVHHEGSATVDTKLDKDDLFARNRLLFLDRWDDPSRVDIPRLPSIDDREWERNLELASLAATWAGRWFEVSNTLSSERARIRRLKAEIEDNASVVEKVYRKLRR